MSEKELFGNSEQLDDTISRRETVKAIRDAMLAWSYMPLWREDKIVDAVKALPSAQQWIPCSERLPEKDGEYLVTMLYFGEKTVEVDRFSHYETDDEHNGEPFWMYGYDNVIAWMPRPEAWKGDKHVTSRSV